MRLKLTPGRGREIERILSAFALQTGFDGDPPCLRLGDGELREGSWAEADQPLQLQLFTGRDAIRLELHGVSDQVSGEAMIDVEEAPAGLRILAGRIPCVDIHPAHQLGRLEERDVPVPHLVVMGTVDPNALRGRGTRHFTLVGDDECEDLASLSEALSGTRLASLSLIQCMTLRSLRGAERLPTLRTLQVNGCERLESVAAVGGLPALEVLDLGLCPSLAALDDLRCLTSLKSLDLSGCDAVASLEALAPLRRLESLTLRSCHSLSDTAGIESLAALAHLDLRWCPSLASLGGVSSLPGLRELRLGGCDALTSVDQLAGSPSINTLDLSYCTALTSIDGLQDMPALQHLDLSCGGQQLSLDGLGALSNLRTLNLSESFHLDSLEPLAGLTTLVELDLSLTGLSSVEFLGELQSLEVLNLALCQNLVSMAELSGLDRLRVLKLVSCSMLESIDGLAALPALQELDLGFCSGLRSAEGLDGCLSLRELNLSHCHHLEEVDVLAGLEALQSLDLSHCSSLRALPAMDALAALRWLNLSGCAALQSVGPLGALAHLQELRLAECSSLASIEGLAGLQGLAVLDLKACRRLNHGSVLHTLPALRELEWDEHPAFTAAVLAAAAFHRGDAPLVRDKAAGWLDELGRSAGSGDAAARLCVSLAQALPLIGAPLEGPALRRWVEIVEDQTCGSVEAWRGLFLSLGRFQGWATWTDALGVLRSPKGFEVVGGLCAAVASEPLQGPARTWAGDWLRGLGSEDPGWHNTLLPVAPELCLAHATLGLHAELKQWLQRFTALDDGDVMDRVYARVARWSLERGDLEQAAAQCASIHDAGQRDPVQANVVRALAPIDPERAGRLFSGIRTPRLRHELADELEGHTGFTAVALNVARLALVRHGDAAGTLALLERIRARHPESPAPNRLAAALPARNRPDDSLLALLLEAVSLRMKQAGHAVSHAQDASLEQALQAWTTARTPPGALH